MKKIILSLVMCLCVSTVAVASDNSEYSYQNRMPFYGNYQKYEGKILNLYENYGNRPPMMYGNYGNRPPMYSNKPQKGKYGNLPPKDGYGMMPPPTLYGNYGNRPPMYSNKPPKGKYGNLPPKDGYGMTPPPTMYGNYGNRPPKKLQGKKQLKGFYGNHHHSYSINIPKISK